MFVLTIVTTCSEKRHGIILVLNIAILSLILFLSLPYSHIDSTNAQKFTSFCMLDHGIPADFFLITYALLLLLLTIIYSLQKYWTELLVVLKLNVNAKQNLNIPNLFYSMAPKITKNPGILDAVLSRTATT